MHIYVCIFVYIYICVYILGGPNVGSQLLHYIDDIVGAASCPEEKLQCFIDHLTNFNSSIKYTYAISNNTVTFLDLQLTIDNNHIKSCVHFKPTDSHNYLLYSSSHPPSCKQSIPFSQLL